MSKLLEFNHYNDLLKHYLGEKRGQSLKLANYLNVNSTFISQVVKGDKHFSHEQAFRVIYFMNWNELEGEYFLNLVQKDRAGTVELQHYYAKKLAVLRREFKKVVNRVKGHKELSEAHKAIYYSDWAYQAVKLCLHMKIDPKLLNLNEHILQNTILFLTDSGIINHLGEVKAIKTHIGTDSPLSKRHHINWRLKAISMYDEMNDDDLAFTAPMTLSKQDLSWFKGELLILIEKLSQRVSNSEDEALAIFNIDLLQFKLK